MQLPLQITFRGLSSSPALEQRIRTDALKLERFYGRITRCHVSVEASDVGHQFQVHIDLTVPGAEIVARRESANGRGDENVYVAVREAFAAVTRQLEAHVRKLRGDVKRHAGQSERIRF